MRREMNTQLHVGSRIDYSGEIVGVWHTNSNGTWFSGWMPDGISTEELFSVSLSTVLDLLKLHPELTEKLLNKIAVL
jgi:hypothetical protein